MKILVALGSAALAGVIGFLCLPRKSRDRLTSTVRHWVTEGCEHMMASLPEGAPPKLVMSVLPKLQAQNDQIVAMLREQNELLREQQRNA